MGQEPITEGHNLRQPAISTCSLVHMASKSAASLPADALVVTRRLAQTVNALGGTTGAANWRFVVQLAQCDLQISPALRPPASGDVAGLRYGNEHQSGWRSHL